MTELDVVGIIEGFYGPPWGWPQRQRAIRFLASQGANTYLYAPKNDPLHRDRWREPYLRDEWERFSELADIGDELGVDLWFGISPLGFRVTDERDVASLVDKLEAADRAGLRRFCLLVDDMPEDFASSRDAESFATLAAAHVALVELVRHTLDRFGDDRRLWFVPLHYHGDPEDAYVREIGAGIPAEIAILWTGPEVCSETLTGEHTAAVARSLRRDVLYWDNHPVNDGAMSVDPHLGPFRGRDPELVEHATGILANVGLQPEASLIAVATLCEFARDPHGYDPEMAWSRALADVTGDPRDADAVALLAELSPRSPLWRRPPLDNRLAEPLARFDAAWGASPAGSWEALEAIDAVLEGLEDTVEVLRHGLRNERLRDDLAPWSGKLDDQVAAARRAVAILASAVRDPGEQAPTERERVLELLASARSVPHWVAGDQLEVFSRSCLRRAGRAATLASSGPPEVAP